MEEFVREGSAEQDKVRGTRGVFSRQTEEGVVEKIGRQKVYKEE